MRSFEIECEQTVTMKLLQTSCAAQSSDSKVQYLPHYLQDFSHSQCSNGHAALRIELLLSLCPFKHSPPHFKAINTTCLVRNKSPEMKGAQLVFIYYWLPRKANIRSVAWVE